MNIKKEVAIVGEANVEINIEDVFKFINDYLSRGEEYTDFLMRTVVGNIINSIGHSNTNKERRQTYAKYLNKEAARIGAIVKKR